jgi:NitT/TauT family transport system substrate-binding protein
VNKFCLKIIVVAAVALLGIAAASAQTVRLAVGGKPVIFYLPLTVAERLGYFKDEGLEVEISDLAGGSRALQSLMGGSADVVTGAFDHTIQMLSKQQSVVAVVQLGRYPGYVLGIAGPKMQTYKGPSDLKGMKIGITAPGSGTHFMVLQYMIENGLKADDASFIGIGVSTTAVAAVKNGSVDAIVNVDPTMSTLQSQGLIKVVADTRTPEGTQAVYGGPYPAAVLYAKADYISKNPAVMQKLVNAFVRTLKWIEAHSPEEIAAVLPPEYALGDKDLYVKSIAASKSMFSTDGRIPRAGAEIALKVIKQFDPEFREAAVDVGKTFDNSFVERSNR